MSGLSYRSLTFMLLIALLLWSSKFETCNARRGKHWRKSRASSGTLFKKKGKSHSSGNHHHSSGGSKPKPPSHKALSPPSHKAPSPPSPAPKKGTPSSPPLPLPPPPEKGHNGGGHSATFNVLDFEAKGDGSTDDTQAFRAAWAAACKVEASMMIIPSNYIFLVGPISFSGPYCQPNIVFQLDGTIIAPTSSKVWGKGLLQWLEFTKLRGITIQGKGVIDGRGSVWWQDAPFDDPVDDEIELIVPLNSTVEKNLSAPVRSQLGRIMPSIKPTALRFYGSFNVTVTGITIQSSPQCHLKFDNCMGVLVHDLSVSSPGDSPNTDGIHLQNSKDILIHSSNLACGDDCVSIQTGCSNIYIHNVNCGPGHGISIGSLGKDSTKACVSNITVRDITMQNTMNGVRIKTWQGGSGSVQGVLFSNIQVSEVQIPIVIDQYYCDKRTCKNQTSAVALSGINYERIRGTYTVKPVHFACSDSLPCLDVTLTAIQLKPQQEKYHMYDPFCWQTFGELRTPTIPPIDCLQIGKPSNNGVQSDHDIC
ncbi:polygalacturonase At1g48100-like isoform X1 [Juglans microcarpa x Juglans regia]|uniref:polygalacturonase At1g48100-like isoform X1 n=1 Tax=Juglans microcarpa x Juglans regia TaxID=2249226 RepID=UPI001B7E4FC8|nr:polygalacturonase At1g48100-like isoform X1 [Juglans microcarpa x Juglans regia]